MMDSDERPLSHGADASAFVIIGNSLYLKAGTTLDFETKSSYNVTVQVDDATLGSTRPTPRSTTRSP